MNVSFKPRNLDEVKQWVKTVPYGGLKVGLAAFIEYIIGNSAHGLRHDEPQKYVSRAQAGYKTSKKQIAYFFAVGILESDGHGGVKLNHYKRTGETAAAWDYTVSNGGYSYTLRNDKEGAYWTRADEGQTRQHALAGRRKVTKVILDNLDGAIRHAVAEISKYLASK